MGENVLSQNLLFKSETACSSPGGAGDAGGACGAGGAGGAAGVSRRDI